MAGWQHRNNGGNNMREEQKKYPYDVWLRPFILECNRNAKAQAPPTPPTPTKDKIKPKYDPCIWY
jgi:hypothetical protein